MKQLKAFIQGIATYLPEGKLTNEDLTREYPDWDVSKIFNKTGISVRSIASQKETAGDLAFEAAEALFAKGICKREEVEFLMLCTQSPDYFLPTTACILQHRLGLPTSCGALDFNLGCSGYIYGLSLAKGLIETGTVKNVLLITSETYSKYLHPSDRSVRTIFGDGAAATFIGGKMNSDEMIGPFVFGTDGSGAEELIVRAGAHRMPPACSPVGAVTSNDALFPSLGNLFMDGAEIFNFSLKVVPAAVKNLLDKTANTLDSIDYFIFHQANKFMLDRLRKKIGIPEDKFCFNCQNYGNTVSATIPMALEIEIAKGTLKKGNTVMLVGFGVGLSWGATLIQINS